MVLFRRNVSRYVNDGHAHRVVVDGELSSLRSLIVHDDRKPLDAWLRAQDRYAREEARKLRSLPRAELGRADRLRQKVWVAPLLMPAYCLIARGLILDGLPGVHYALQRTYAEILLSLRLLAE